MSGRTLKLSLVALLALVAVILIVPLIIRFSVVQFMYANVDDVPHRDVAIVLGASVYGNEPSPILAMRADTAAALYLKGKVKKILISGDQAPYHDEVTATENYLLQSGIPMSAILLDGKGFDTYQSMYRARAVFGIRSAIVVTQDFHMPRALFLARAEGIDAVGAIAPGAEAEPFFYVREIPATWKALFDVYIGRSVPKLL